MVRCSFCGHDNNDCAMFCASCKTDLTIPAAVDVPSVEGTADPVTDTLHFEKIALVQSLGTDSSSSGELTQPGQQAGKVGVLMSSLPTAADFERSSPASTVAAPSLEAIPQESRPRLVVLRGEKIDMRYPIYAGKNYIGRTDEKPVDIDLENQEPVDRIWTSRQHAVITFENGLLTIEDLNSLNGTFVNRTRVHPGQVRTLQVNDLIQVGTVHMRVMLG